MNDVLCLQVMGQVFNFLSGSDANHLLSHRQSIASAVCAMVESHYRLHWAAEEQALFSVTQAVDAAIDGLTVELTGTKQIFPFAGASYYQTDSLSIKKVKGAVPPECFAAIDEALRRLYSTYSSMTRLPFSKIDKGQVRLLFVSAGYMTPAALTDEVVKMCTHNQLKSQGPNHMVVVINSPLDLMKPMELWDEDDRVGSDATRVPSASTVPEVKLRGKHELLHGAYSKDAPRAAVTQAATWTPFDNEDELRQGGDKVFRTLVRCLHKWISQTTAGARRVTIVSCNWAEGFDFSLTLDGISEYFINHISLEVSGQSAIEMPANTAALIHRMKQSFNDKVSLEFGPLTDRARNAVLEYSGNADNAPTFDLVPLPPDPRNYKCASRVPLLLQGVKINPNPYLCDLTQDTVALEVQGSGYGYIVCSIYEVPYMVPFNDASRLIATEVSSMTPLQVKYKRCIGKMTEMFVFDKLTSFCAYCIVVSSALTYPDGEWKLRASDITEPMVLSHFRTLEKTEAVANTCLLAGVSRKDYTSPSDVIECIIDQLDGARRPLAAPVVLIESDSYMSEPHGVDGAITYSSEMNTLRRMGLTVHCGIDDHKFSLRTFDFDGGVHYDTSTGGLTFSANGKFCRLVLDSNTERSLRKLYESICTVLESDNIENIQVFAPRPLVHHMENTVATVWKQSRHFSSQLYFSTLSKAITKILEWKESKPGRDCQIYSVVHISEPVVCYIHRSKQRVFGGIRQFILPINTGTKSSEERIAVPLGLNKFSNQLSFAAYICKSTDLKGDLPPGSPCQLVYPLFHLHGLQVSNYSDISKKITYKIVSLVGSHEDDEEDAMAAHALYGYHHQVVIKMVTEDIDNIELVLGPIVGNVSYTSCSILVEVNREVCQLKCVLRPVECIENAVEVVQYCDPYVPVKYEFQNLDNGLVYEIFMPEIHGNTVLGKFCTLSLSSPYSEMIFLGDEHLECFPTADIICQELSQQQVVNFCHLQYDSMVKRYVSDMKVLRSSMRDERDGAPPYRRPWNVLADKMKGLCCTTSAVFHLGSHALMSRLVRELATPFIEIVKKYNLDNEDMLKASALSTLYYMQLVQVVEDSLRLVWVIEPSIKDVFQSASNIPLYNAEYWLSEEDIWGEGVPGASQRDIHALEIIRKLYQKSLLSYIYSLRDWDKRSYNHFYRWNEGTVTVAAMDQTSEQLEYQNKESIRPTKNAELVQNPDEEKPLEEEGDDDNEEAEESEKKDPSAIKASTFSAKFMSENQWKRIRQILVDKSVNQIVICSQYPLVPLKLMDDDFSTSLSSGNKLWNPPEEDVAKFFEQLFKWLSPKKAALTGKTVTLVTTADVSYMTNIRHLRSGMNIQQICLGKFSCVNKAFANARQITPTNFTHSGRLGGIKYIHRIHGLDAITLDSSRLGGGGRYTGEQTPWQKENCGAYGLVRFWFDSWMAIGSANLLPIHSSGPIDRKTTTDALVVVGPIVGCPYITITKDGNRMMIPVLIEVDRDINISMIATDLFSGKQLTRSMHLEKNVPLVIRVGPLRTDSRYTLDFSQGIQNSHASRLVLNTYLNWDETNMALLNAETYGAEDPSNNSSDYVHDLIKRFSVPFSGLCGVLHTNVHVDVTAILDEVKTMPGLNTMIERAKSASAEAVTSMLFRFVKNVLERVRTEYRLFLSKPSYRELLLKGFNIFMCRDDIMPDTGEDSLMSLLNLIVSRVRQEYFDQLICPDDRVFSAWPRVKTSNEQAEYIRREFPEEEYIGNMMVLTAENIADREILKIPKVRKPDRIYFDSKEDAALCVLQQWTKNLVCPPPAWVPWVSPNGLVRIELCCAPDDHNIREIHDAIMTSDVKSCARIIVLPTIGNLLNSQCRVGYKLQEWITQWIGKNTDRSINLACPSVNGEGTFLCSVSYFNGYAQLIIQMLNSVFCSNEKVLAKARRDKLAIIKKKTPKVAASRKAMAKRLELERELKNEMQVELDALFNELTPDGYVLFENKRISHELESTGQVVTVMTSEMKSIGSKIDKSVDEYGNLLYPQPSLFDYLYLPPWFPKFCPGTPGVFVQDEVNILLRHDPNYRTALNIIELDESLFQDMRRVYEASPLSEYSRPEDLREIDIDIPGVIEIALENAIEKIWIEVLPVELKGRMLTLTDDFVRSYCCARAFSDLDASLSSSLAFAASMQVLVLAAIQLFLACKMATGVESDMWKYILDTPEFPEDFDVPYVSDDDSDEVDSDDQEDEDGDDEAQATNETSPMVKEDSDAGEPVPTEVEENGGVELAPASDEVPPENHGNEVDVVEESGQESGPSERDAVVERLYAEVYQLSYRRILKRKIYGEMMMYMSSALHM